MAKTPEPEIIEQVEQTEFSEALDGRFTIYANKVLEDRALPEARDGLKPSQRRVLVAMHDLKLTARSATEKSAKICGDTSGNYHPHGESVVYPTMYRLVQDWIMREPLLFGQGNFGNIDGDNPAAMRYTEATLSHFGELMMQELSEDVVPFVPNYNEKRLEPTVLPAMFPNLLVNGTQGIAVGWATYLPQHNYREVIAVVKAFIKNPDITPKQIIKIMPGPDYPTGGRLLGQDGVLDYYTAGKGSIQLEGKYEITPKGDQIIITELPYQTSPEKLQLEIADLARDGKLQGVTDCLNLGKDTVNVVVELARGTNAQLVVNNLLKQTSLRKQYGVNQTVLINGKVVADAPVVALVKAFVDHRRDVTVKKLNAELRRQQARLHILEGLIVVASRIDEVIKIVRNADDEVDASRKLIAAKIVTSQLQADAVLAITLRQLTKLEGQKLLDEQSTRQARVAWIEGILSNKDEIDRLIIEEQDELAKKYGSPRKTEVVGVVTDLSNEDLIKDEQLLVSITSDGYVKALPSESFKVQGRGGVGVNNGDGKREDNVFEMFEAHSKHYILFFSNKGVMYKKKAYEIPQASRTAKGMHVSNLLELEEGEFITNMIAVKSLSEDGFLIIATRDGVIKRTQLSEYDSSRTAIVAIKLVEKDQVNFASYSNGEQDVFIITANGNCVRYNESIIPVQGRSTQGCRALKLDGKDQIAQVFLLDKKAEPDILVVTKGGYGKRSESDEFRALGNRNVKGYAVINRASLTKNGLVVGAAAITGGDSILVATTKGKVIRMDAADIKATGRTTNGVKVVRLETGDTVTRLTKMKESEVDEDGEPKAVVEKVAKKATADVDAAPTPKPSPKTVTPVADGDINAKGKWGYTPLHTAAVAGDDAECDRLIGLGADKTAKDNSGKLPWQKAEYAGFEKLAEKLKP